MSMRKEQLGGAGVPGCGDLACVFNEIPVSLRPPWKSVQKKRLDTDGVILRGPNMCQVSISSSGTPSPRSIPFQFH